MGVVGSDWLIGKRSRVKSQLATTLNAESARHGRSAGPQACAVVYTPLPLRAPQP